jgi:hypothetical protein
MHPFEVEKTKRRRKQKMSLHILFMQWEKLQIQTAWVYMQGWDAN